METKQVGLIEGMTTFSRGSYFLLKQAESNTTCSKNIVQFLRRCQSPVLMCSIARSHDAEYKIMRLLKKKFSFSEFNK